jgi:hypothetical protein
MIMPADPQLGDVYRPENVPGFVFEEVTVKSVDETVRGPTGPVEGAIIAEELHQDGAREDKTFAPGYGEFFTGAGGDVEALALAVPEDALRAQPPAELEALLRAANDVFAQADRNVGPVAKRSARAVARAWEALQAEEIPVRLRPVTAAAVKALGRAVESRDSRRTQQASLDVAQSGLDLELRYRPPSEIDRERFEVWARQLVLDARVKDGRAAAGDLATLEWIRDRFAHTLDKVERIEVDTSLAELRTLVNEDDLQGAAREAGKLSALIAGP